MKRHPTLLQEGVVHRMVRPDDAPPYTRVSACGGSIAVEMLGQIRRALFAGPGDEVTCQKCKEAP